MSRNPRSEAREFAIQFLYQSESEKLYHFSEGHFRGFVDHFEVPTKLIETVREMVSGTFEKVADLDARIEAVAANWKLSRMPAVDRNVLRLATYELTANTAPRRVVINEAIELAKKYGAAESGRFVNGILDKIARSLGPSQP